MPEFSYPNISPQVFQTQWTFQPPKKSSSCSKLCKHYVPLQASLALREGPQRPSGDWVFDQRIQEVNCNQWPASKVATACYLVHPVQWIVLVPTLLDENQQLPSLEPTNSSLTAVKADPNSSAKSALTKSFVGRTLDLGLYRKSYSLSRTIQKTLGWSPSI